MATVITQNELLEALAAANAAPAEARTTRELADITGWNISRVKDAIRALSGVGRIETHRVSRTDIAGRVTRVPAYTIKPAPKRTAK